MTFLQSGQATTDPEFRLRVQAAIFKLAQDVLNEPPSVGGYHLRRQLAQSIIADPVAAAGRFVWLCASNPSIAATVTVEAGPNGPDIQVSCPDGDIEFVCASNWDEIAGWQMIGPGSMLTGGM